jgi:hypothetical protein
MSENEFVLFLIISLYSLIVILIKSFNKMKNDYCATTWREYIGLNAYQDHEMYIRAINSLLNELQSSIKKEKI